MDKEKKKSQKIFKKAENAFYKQNYSLVIDLLETKIFYFRDDFLFYFYMAISYLYVGDGLGGKTYLQRCLTMDPDNEVCRLVHVILLIKEKKIDKAIVLLLSMIEQSESKNIVNLLNDLKENIDDKDFNKWVNSARFKKYYPRIRRAMDFYNIFFSMLIFIIILTFSSIIVVNKWQEIKDFFIPKKRELVSNPNLDLVESMTSLTGSFVYVYSDLEIYRVFANARSLLESFDDNQAQVEMNKILFSNASEAVKSEVRKMKLMVEPASFVKQPKTKFSFEEISKEATLFSGTYVVWRGRTVNVNVEGANVSFDLLIDYEDKKKLTGIAAAQLGFYSDLQNDMPIEVIAQIELRPNLKDFYINVISLRPLVAIN